jgi:hypothetical protein
MQFDAINDHRAWVIAAGQESTVMEAAAHRNQKSKIKNWKEEDKGSGEHVLSVSGITTRTRLLRPGSSPFRHSRWSPEER